MSKAISTVDTAFQKFVEAERIRPVQRNLFTGEPEALRVEVPGQIRNQERLVRYFGKYLKKADPERFDRINAIADSLAAQWKKIKALAAATVDEKRHVLMGVEGVAGRGW